MSIWKLILAEIRVRPWSFAIATLVIAVATTAVVAGPLLLNAYARQTAQAVAQLEAETQKELAKLDKQTKRIMRDLGVNLRIVHRDTKLGGLYTDFKAVDFPEAYVDKLAEAPQIETIVHVIATLQEKITWKGRTALLVGMRPVLTASQKNEEKPHMVKPVEPGTVILGYELAGDVRPGDTVEILGKSFRVASVRPQSGTLEDVQLVMDLHEAQQLVGKPGRIHQILALNCKCKGNRISRIRKELEGVLPDTKVTEHLSRATAREKQRDAVEQSRKRQIARLQADRRRTQKATATLLNILLPLTVAFSAAIVGLLSWLNVRERRSEVGILRALGKSAPTIACLFLGKALLVGLLGGLLGCLGAYFTAEWLIRTAEAQTFAPLAWDSTLGMAALLGAPLVAAMAAYLPTLSALTQDPAAILTS
ncbi:MAG TPA: FtsX-like permease family protein [Planctomycetaceae bacterium]|nr:FtsX-like permease family protein [Planctomycetaceae bacterium]